MTKYKITGTNKKIEKEVEIQTPDSIHGLARIS